MSRFIIVLDLVAGCLMVADLVLSEEFYGKIDRLLRRFLSGLGSSYLLLSSMAVMFVLSAAIVGISNYKDIVAERVSALELWGGTILLLSCLVLGCIAAAFVRFLCQQSPESSNRLDYWLALLYAITALSVCVLSFRFLSPPLRYLPVGFVCGASILQSVISIVKDLSAFLNRQRRVLILTGLLLFIVARIMQLALD